MEGSSGNSTPSVPGPVLTSDKPTFFCNKVLAGGFWWTYVPPPQPSTTKQKVWLHLSILTPALPAGKTCNRVKKCEVAVMVFRGKSAVVLECGVKWSIKWAVAWCFDVVHTVSHCDRVHPSSLRVSWRHMSPSHSALAVREHNWCYYKNIIWQNAEQHNWTSR